MTKHVSILISVLVFIFIHFQVNADDRTESASSSREYLGKWTYSNSDYIFDVVIDASEITTNYLPLSEIGKQNPNVTGRKFSYTESQGKFSELMTFLYNGMTKTWHKPSNPKVIEVPWKIVSGVLILHDNYQQPFSRDRLSATIATTIDYHAEDAWKKTIHQGIPVFSTMGKVVRGQGFDILTVLHNPILIKELDSLFLRMSIIAPDGQEIFQNQYALPSGVPYPNQEILLNSFRYSFSEGTSLGKYRIEGMLTEGNQGQEVYFSGIVELIERLPSKVISNEQEFSLFINNYYGYPEPGQLMESLRFFLSSQVSEKNTSIPPMVGFYSSTFIENPYLMKMLKEFYLGLPDKGKRFVLQVESSLPEEMQKHFSTILTDQEALFLANVTIGEHRLSDTEISDPSQLDFLWGEFYATGSYDVIYKFIQILGQEKLHPLILTAAKWSLTSNIKSYNPLVKQFCTYMLAEEPLSEDIKSQLRLMLP